MHPNRTCMSCRRCLEPEGTRSWFLNGSLPLGTTVKYECAICQNAFEVRTPWHLAVLTFAFVVLALSLGSLSKQSVFGQLCVLLAVTYMAYALVSDAWYRYKNPVHRAQGQ